METNGNKIIYSFGYSFDICRNQVPEITNKFDYVQMWTKAGITSHPFWGTTIPVLYMKCFAFCFYDYY